MSNGHEGETGAGPVPDGELVPRRSPAILVVADDLMWSTRLADALRRAGAEPRVVRSPGQLAGQLADADGCVVDLTARAYDGIAAVATAAGSGLAVIAVGQHDDPALRRAASDAGASRVYAYRRLFEHGDDDLGAWVSALRGGGRRATTGDAV